MVGGRNGGGKTTLFESVLLCLYGRGPRESKRAYQGRLAGLIHRGADNALTERRASVSVRFQTHREGSTREYIVERTWSPAKDGVFEEVSVKRSQDADGGFEQLDLDRDRWQSYMEGLVPRGIASLFFFDGERVAIMADGDQSDTIMASFDSLLGLDAIDRLRADLRYNLARSLTGDDAHLQTEFDRLTEEKRAAETESETLKESYVQKKAELEAANAKLAEGESHLTVLGGGLAKRRDILRKDLAAERQSLEGHAKALAEVCSSYLPFGVIPDKLRGSGRTDGQRPQCDAGQDKKRGRPLHHTGHKGGLGWPGRPRDAVHNRRRRTRRGRRGEFHNSRILVCPAGPHIADHQKRRKGRGRRLCRILLGGAHEHNPAGVIAGQRPRPERDGPHTADYKGMLRRGRQAGSRDGPNRPEDVQAWRPR